VVCGGGAAMFGSIAAVLLGGAKPARAEGISLPVPEVDSLAVRVVIDSYQFAVAPSRKAEGLDIQHFGWGISADKPPRRTLISEFGLSMHVQSQRGAERRNIIIDFGFTPEAMVNNTDLLGIDPAEIDALVLSHGHYDHFGGLVGFLRQHQAKLKPNLPFYIGGEECFCSREWIAPPAPGNFGALDRVALETAKLTVTTAEGPSVVADHAFTTGQIPLASFEQVRSPSAMILGVEKGLGCYPDRLSVDQRSKTTVPDLFRHEIATVFNLRGRGLIVLTSCSHRGVINTIRQAQAVSGVEKICAVIGGFHLAPYSEDYVRETIAALKTMDVDHIIPLHCTGETFIEMVRAEMPSKLLRSYTGTRLILN
jgi:7,8-dihydropterin-6-yl-methyl-4-(beta-D-ribofuranosyl)aminobenzene 5'-phosphate synthase